MIMGTVRIKLGELLQERQLSKNKFAQRAELERTQLNRYINNEVALLSVDVLARMCATLNCKIEDLLEYTEEWEGVRDGFFFYASQSEVQGLVLPWTSTLDFCVLCQSPESRGFMRVSGQNFYTSRVC